MGKKRRDIEVTVILDRSGSMQSLAEATVKGFNGYVSELPKGTPVTLVQFDAPNDTPDIDEVFSRKPAEDIVLADYEPRGWTPLLDAVGITVSKARDLKSKLDQIVVIVTDGLENASREWTREKVRALIEGLEKKGWQFVFMGAGIDAYDEGASIGTQSANTYAYAATPGSTMGAWGNVTRSTTDYSSYVTNSVSMPDHDTADPTYERKAPVGPKRTGRQAQKMSKKTIRTHIPLR